MLNKQCAICGNTFEPYREWHITCSINCKNKWHYLCHKKPKPPCTLSCDFCGKPLDKFKRFAKPYARHCSVYCQQAAWNVSKKHKIKAKCRSCGKYFTARIHKQSACSLKCRGRLNRNRFREYYSDQARKRRTLKDANKFKVTPKDLRRLLVRQDGICYLCGLKMKEPTVDHIIALRVGGRHSIGNLAWACFRCNIRKGKRFLIEVRYGQLDIGTSKK